MISRKTLIGILACCTALLVAACGQRHGRQDEAEACIDSLSYAEHFEIARTTGYKRVTIFNPWNQGQVLDRFYLVHDSAVEVPDDGRRIQIPIQRLMIASASHIGYLEALDRLPAAILCPDTAQIYSQTLKAQVKNGGTVSFGDPYAVNTETVLRGKPDLVMMIGYAGADQSTERLRSLSQPVMRNVEWTEKTILGRAEWIKLFAAFFDLEAQADSIFEQTAARYRQLQSLARDAEPKPQILPGHPFRGTWYMPGGQAGMAQMFHDAGGRYAYSGNTASESIGIDLETVVRDFWQADIWIGADARSIKSLLGEDPRYALLKPVKNHQVYNNQRHTSATGGNLYWETTQVHPDWLLEDLIRVLHPGLLPEGEFRYLQHLE